MIQVEVIFALPDQQPRAFLALPDGSTVINALEAASFLKEFDLKWDDLAWGIFGRRVELATPLQNDDRLEIYRPILFDPKEKRVLKVKDSTLPRRCK